MASPSARARRCSLAAGSVSRLCCSSRRDCRNSPFLIGGRSEREVFWKELLAPLAEKIYVTTDDGSFGTKGFTTTLLPDVLAKETPARVVTCGPTVMMQGIAKIVRDAGLPCEVSLEKRMACGIGVCLGCTFETTRGTRKKVCVDGPVFDAKEVFA